MDVAFAYMSFPRKWESSDLAEFTLLGLWIPTFVGMTDVRKSISEVGFGVKSTGPSGGDLTRESEPLGPPRLRGG